jgi:hypothetical protein
MLGYPLYPTKIFSNSPTYQTTHIRAGYQFYWENTHLDSGCQELQTHFILTKWYSTHLLAEYNRKKQRLILKLTYFIAFNCRWTKWPLLGHPNLKYTMNHAHIKKTRNTVKFFNQIISYIKKESGLKFTKRSIWYHKKRRKQVALF